jgi:tetratricopeptide (TPR) repeat protein
MLEINRAQILLVAAAVASGALTWGCAPQVKESERYKPPESLLEILTDYQRHLNDDTYRFATFKDITGQNIYKATLIRLKNFERLYPNKFAPIVAYSRAKAYEKLHDYKAAVASYQQIIGTGNELEPKAKEGLRVCRDFIAANTMGRTDGSVQSTLKAYDGRLRALERLIQTNKGTPYGYLARELGEQAATERVTFIEANRTQIDNGTELTIVEYNRIIKRHEESKNVYRHILRLGSFFEEQAREYASRHNPEGLSFSMSEFKSYADSAMGLYTMVASKDGIIEKAEAQGLANSLRAYTTKVRNLHR